MARIRKHPTFLSLILWAIAAGVALRSYWVGATGADLAIYLGIAFVCVVAGRSLVAWTSCSECHEPLARHHTHRCPRCRSFFHPIDLSRARTEPHSSRPAAGR